MPAEAATEAVVIDVEEGILRGRIINDHSSFAAFCLCVNLRPLDLPELLKIVGVYGLSPLRRNRAFNACVDGYAVFDDGRMSGQL